jgi:hypothetical protein
MEVVVNPIDLPRVWNVKSDGWLKVDVGAKGVNASGLWSNEERKGTKIRDWGKSTFAGTKSQGASLVTQKFFLLGPSKNIVNGMIVALILMDATARTKFISLDSFTLLKISQYIKGLVNLTIPVLLRRHFICTL